MVDLQKPCVKCGAVDRYKNGECRACDRNRKRKRAMVVLTKPCVKCGAVDRYKYGDCRACDRKRIRKRIVVDLTKPCVKCGEVGRFSNGNCKACDRNRRTNYRKTNAYREIRKKQDYKAKKLKFEFSLQTQQKAIEQCQQKLTESTQPIGIS